MGEYRFNNCLGARDAFYWNQRNKWKSFDGKPVDKLLYSRIVSEVNKILAEMLLEGHEIEFPHQMGSLVLTKSPGRAIWKDGELLTNYWTDWPETYKLRAEDEESREAHVKVKRIQPFVYKIRYYKRKARYRNSWFYDFHPNRSLVRTMGAAIEGQRMNAEQIEYYNN